MKQYILLKDLPDVKAGAIFEIGEVLDVYILCYDKTGTKYNTYSYPKSFVVSNSDWFRPVEETKWNDELVCDACLYVGMNIDGKEDIKKQIPVLLAKYKSKQNNDNYNNFYEKKYTEKDMKECFNNAKYMLRDYFHSRTSYQIKEPEFEDYLKRINHIKKSNS